MSTAEDMPTSYFSDLTVLDFTGELGPYAAKLYAGLGANVVHLEPMSGDPLRRASPFYKNIRGPDSSLPYLYYNAGKRGLALDLDQDAGRNVFRELCKTADLLIESCVPGYLDRLGMSYAELSRDNRRLVQTSITPFGHSGPLANSPGSELTCSALGGFLYLAGVANDKPVRAPDNQAYRMAEGYASVGSAIALFEAQRTGNGQFVDVACVEATAMALETAAQCWDLTGTIRRGRGREAGVGTLHPCSDGYIIVVANLGHNKVMWPPFVRWMKEEHVTDWEVFDDDKWLESAYRTSEEGYGTFCRIFDSYTREHTKLHVYELAQRYSVAAAPVSTGRDLLENPQLQHLDFWKTMPNEALDGDVVYPGPPYYFGDLQWRLGANAPRFGQHTIEVLAENGYSPPDIADLVKIGAVHAEQR